MAYTNITKPTGTSYTNLNGIGKYQYDQADIAYDDSAIFYDGYGNSLYTNIAKPIDGDFTTIPIGTATGLLIPLTTPTARTFGSSGYTKITKPTL